MTEKTGEWFLTQGVLGVMCAILLAAVAWLMLKLLATQNKCDEEKQRLNDAHKNELRENGKANADLAQRVVLAIERLTDLEENRRR